MARRPEAVTKLRREVGAVLAAYLDASPLTQGDLARETNYHRTSIAHIQAGRQFPGREFWEKADKVLGAGGVLVAHYDEARSREEQLKQAELARQLVERRARVKSIVESSGKNASSRFRPGVPETLDGVKERPVSSRLSDNAHDEEKLDDVNRKAFLQVAFGAAAGALVGRDLSDYDASDLVSAIAAPTRNYRRMEAAVSTAELTPAVEAHLRLASGMVADSLPTSVGYGVLSETAGLAAWLAADQGEEGTARRRYVQALRYAERAQHPLLTAYMRASLGHFAVEVGDPRPGLVLLERAQHEIKDHDVPDAARAWLASLQSLAHATMNDGAAALAQLRTAESLAGTDRGDPQWPWVFAFDAPKAARYRAATLALLGDLRGARTAFAAASVALTAPKPRALAQVEHARVLARACQVDEAAVLALDALSVARRYASVRVAQRIRALRRLLPAATPETAELDDQLTALYTEGR